MAILLVTYDLNRESDSSDYEGLLQQIKQYSWARLSESSYAIETSSSPKAIYDELLPYLDEDDNLLVITLTTPYYGRNRKDVIDWLTQHLK